ncbi:MAG: nucleotidyltransferase domain-containing protein [Candidatus Manganitrophaceae bacterium]
MQIQVVVTDSVVRAVKRHLPFRHYRVFYFGSRVSGGATRRSDYDVGLDAGEKIPLEVMAGIREEIEEIPVLQKIDLVDFRAVPEAFARQAMEKIEMIYEQ